MKRPGFRGSACIEFAFVTMLLVPLLLGTGAAGIDMILTLQTIQLARDAGHIRNPAIKPFWPTSARPWA
jgi:hypothetical protein